MVIEKALDLFLWSLALSHGTQGSGEINELLSQLSYEGSLTFHFEGIRSTGFNALILANK